MLGRSGLRVVTCHLGAEASLAAVRDGIASMAVALAGAGMRILVVAAREDLQIAWEVRHVLAAGARQRADGAAP